MQNSKQSSFLSWAQAPQDQLARRPKARKPTLHPEDEDASTNSTANTNMSTFNSTYSQIPSKQALEHLGGPGRRRKG